MNSRRSRRKNEDRLSHLPDEVLSHIHSLIPTIHAMRTSVLSKKWRYNWTLVTNFDFDNSDFKGLNPFSKFVDRVLKLCKTSQLKLFRLRRPLVFTGKSDLLKWINEAVRLNVCGLDIEVIPTELPFSVFTCKTLTKLRLAMGNGLDIVNVPSLIMLPGLKTLDIRVGNKSSATISRFIHGCPVLESLSLDIMLDEQDCNFNIPTLKRMELRTRGQLYLYNKTPCFVLNVPNLEYLFVGGFYCPHFVMKDLPSSVEATVKFRDHTLVVDLLKGLSGVKSLSWSTSLLQYAHFTYFPLPKIPNLKHVELKDTSYDLTRKFVIEILESCSGLEHLCFKEPQESCWIEPWSVPTCMLSKLKTIKITKGLGAQECGIHFLKYLLGNAEVLKRLTLICENLSMAEKTELRARLLRFPRASRFCEIHIVRKWLNSFCAGASDEDVFGC